MMCQIVRKPFTRVSNKAELTPVMKLVSPIKESAHSLVLGSLADTHQLCRLGYRDDCEPCAAEVLAGRH